MGFGERNGDMQVHKGRCCRLDMTVLKYISDARRATSFYTSLRRRLSVHLANHYNNGSRYMRETYFLGQNRREEGRCVNPHPLV